MDIRGQFAKEMPEMSNRKMEQSSEHAQMWEVRVCVGITHPKPQEVFIMQKSSVEQTRPSLDLSPLSEVYTDQKQHPYRPVSIMRQESSHEHL